jgi:hypothetical protein
MGGSRQSYWAGNIRPSERVTKWVGEVEEAEERRRHHEKRKHLPNMPLSDSSNKRPRPCNDSDPIYVDQTSTSRSELSLDQHVRLTPSVRSSQRSRSPTKELQLQIRDSINIRGPESGQTSIPPAVRDLQKRLSKEFGAKVIPGGLSVGCLVNPMSGPAS